MFKIRFMLHSRDLGVNYECRICNFKDAESNLDSLRLTERLTTFFSSNVIIIYEMSIILDVGLARD